MGERRTITMRLTKQEAEIITSRRKRRDDIRRKIRDFKKEKCHYIKQLFPYKSDRDVRCTAIAKRDGYCGNHYKVALKSGWIDSPTPPDNPSPQIASEPLQD
jgi:hypothetical protein